MTMVGTAIDHTVDGTEFVWGRMALQISRTNHRQIDMATE
jgi:hypothetical protein